VNTRYERSRQYVGIDLHRRRSVIVRLDGEGEVLDCVQIENSVPALVGEVGKAGVGAPVAVEATYGWYWAVDALRAAGFVVTLAHPRGVASMQGRRAKTDKLDAKELANLLRLDRLATAWTAPPEVRELRELVRYRHKPVATRLKSEPRAWGGGPFWPHWTLTLASWCDVCRADITKLTSRRRDDGPV